MSELDTNPRPFPKVEDTIVWAGKKLKLIIRRPGSQLDPRFQLATVPNHTSQRMVTVIYEDEGEAEDKRSPLTSSKMVEASELISAIEDLAARVVDKVRTRPPRYR